MVVTAKQRRKKREFNGTPMHLLDDYISANQRCIIYSLVRPRSLIESTGRRSSAWLQVRKTMWSSISNYLSGPISNAQQKRKSNWHCHFLLGWSPRSQRRQEARLILFYKIINGLAQVPFEGVLKAISVHPFRIIS